MQHMLRMLGNIAVHYTGVLSLRIGVCVRRKFYARNRMAYLVA
jgi:hypothetical protein